MPYPEQGAGYTRRPKWLEEAIRKEEAPTESPLTQYLNGIMDQAKDAYEASPNGKVAERWPDKGAAASASTDVADAEAERHLQEIAAPNHPPSEE